MFNFDLEERFVYELIKNEISHIKETFLCSDFNCFMLLSFTNHEDNRFKIKRKDS